MNWQPNSFIGFTKKKERKEKEDISLLLRSSCSTGGDKFVSRQLESPLLNATLQLKRGYVLWYDRRS